jgi:hypothetical protein
MACPIEDVGAVPMLKLLMRFGCLQKRELVDQYLWWVGRAAGVEVIEMWKQRQNLGRWSGVLCMSA